jgi:AcrR family transcriptional regulator
MPSAAGPRTLRADAQRNQDRILAAAREAFAEQGYEVPIEEVARRAGVGAATIYRRFPTKERLLWAIVDHGIAELELVIGAAAETSDPWLALLGGMRAVVEIQTDNMVFLQVLDQAGVMGQFKPEIERRIHEPLCELFARAQAAGEVRGDLDPSELPLLIQMITATAKRLGASAANERYLALLADALRTPTPSPLPST